MTREEALEKLKRYCAYQDRCHQEVRTKLLSLKIYGDWLEEVMSDLIQDGYLNDERFAKNYARGKYRIKGWGKVKITQALKARRISEYCIRQAMKEIDEEGGYLETLQGHLEKYVHLRKQKLEKPVLMKKAYAHGISKGFESNLVRQELSSIASLL